MYLPKPNPSVEIYSEVSDDSPAAESDIEEFAKRIGIDLEVEPHLKYLAEEGLKAPLPVHWKPCKDLHKKSFYYFNKETNGSQWTHPMDEVYRTKVIQARQDLAMNRIQEIGSGGLGRPQTKSLPPLKKLGNAKPPSGIGLNKLGPLGSSNTLNSSSSQLNGGSRASGDGLISNSLGEMDSKKDKSENDNVDNLLQNPSSRMIKKPLGGLILTGEGSKFLKGEGRSEQSSNKPEGLTTNETQTQDAPPIKSILINSSNQSKKSGLVKKEKEKSWGMMNPDILTDNEKQIVEELLEEPQRPSVKFQLDADSPLKFELTDENITKSEVTEDETSKSESSSSRDASDSLPRKSKYKGKKTKSKSSASDASSRNSNADDRSGTKVPPHLMMSQAATEAMKETMKKDMDTKLKEYQQELDKERRKREDQIKKHMDTTVISLKLQKESEIKRIRNESEHQKNIELDKVKRELEAIIMSEVDKLKLHFEKELDNKKSEMRTNHQKAIEALSTEYQESLVQERANETMNRKQLQESLFKEQKDSLGDEQIKQIQKMKDYHKSFIEKLKLESEAEVLELKTKHLVRLGEMEKAFEIETCELRSELKSKQDSNLNNLVAEYEKEKDLVEQELREGLSYLKNQMNVIKTKAEESVLNKKSIEVIKPFEDKNETSPQEKKEDELKILSAKYDQLEKKYTYLKKELKKLTPRPNNEPKDSVIQSIEVSKTRNNVPLTKSEPISSYQNDNNRLQKEIDKSVPSDSQSESTTFYPSSSFHNPDQNSDDPEQELYQNPKEILKENDDKLSTALKSLEILKSQILNIKEEKEKTPASPTKVSKPLQQKRSSSRQIKKNSNLNSSCGGVAKPSTAYTPKKSSSSLNQNGTLRNSKSTSELPGLVEDTEDQANEVVKEAKEFIRSQKERLNSGKETLKFDRQISTTWSNPSGKKGDYRYSLDEISYPPGLNRTYQAASTSRISTYPSPSSRIKSADFHSETESSGIGSMKDLESQEKKQISKDIETICSSLSNLDQQMKLMWTVVQQGQGRENNALDNNNKSNLNTMLSNQRYNATYIPSNSVNTPQRPFTSVDFGSGGGVGGFSSSNRALLESLKAASLPNSRVSNTSNLLNSLDKELQEFKNAKTRIINQFNGQTSTLPNKDENIQEKTNDLRKWLDRF